MRRAPLRAAPPVEHRDEPGYRDWHQPIWGKCACCGQPGRLERHHVIKEQHVRAIDPSKVWDLRDSLELGMHCPCHRLHTTAARKLPASAIPAEAIEFAIELLGARRAEDYIDRYYAPGRPP